MLENFGWVQIAEPKEKSVDRDDPFVQFMKPLKKENTCQWDTRALLIGSAKKFVSDLEAEALTLDNDDNEIERKRAKVLRAFASQITKWMNRAGYKLSRR